ncbi:thioredoxin family protein [Candidatus Bathyarchaeota archaeon]|nr:MAG: thioredoxin family protein [Candidatus Bathyarchaeota archaeon]
MPHKIVAFTGNCPLCNEVVDEIEAGKCAGCQLIVVNVAENRALAKEYDIKVVPTVIIDGEVRIEGKPDIPFVCSDETYLHFKSRYPLIHKLNQSTA